MMFRPRSPWSTRLSGIRRAAGDTAACVPCFVACGILYYACVSPGLVGQVSTPISFVDIAVRAGIRLQNISGHPDKPYILESMGGGIAWIDYNRDGWPDL